MTDSISNLSFDPDEENILSLQDIPDGRVLFVTSNSVKLFNPDLQQVVAEYRVKDANKIIKCSIEKD